MKSPCLTARALILSLQPCSWQNDSGMANLSFRAGNEWAGVLLFPYREGRNTDECFCWISNHIVLLIDYTRIICQLLSFDFSKFQLLQMFVRNLKEDPFVLHPVLLHFFSRSKAQFLKQEFDSNTNTSEILSFDTWQGYIYDIYKSCEASRCICWRRT